MDHKLTMLEKRSCGTTYTRSAQRRPPL